MRTSMFDERINHDPAIQVQHVRILSNDDETCDPTATAYGQSTNDIEDVSGIDVTKSLYHLRLHGFDMIAKNYQASSEASSPSRIACVTPAVSPVHDTYSYRKRPSHLPDGNTTPKIISRPISPQFIEMTPPHARRLTLTAPKVTESVITNGRQSSQNTNKLDITSTSRNPLPLSETITSEKNKIFQRVLPTTNTYGEDEFEVMLESSVSSDEYDEHNEYLLQNESSIMDSPQSLPSYSQNKIHNNVDGDESCDILPSTISPLTPAQFNFCGIPSWCETNTTNTTGRHLFQDDCSMANSFQLHHTSSSEWFSCPTSTTVCCVSTLNENDTVGPQYGNQQIAVLQNLLQNHICTSLGDSIETLCWQKSATSVLPKDSTGSIQVDSISFPSIGEENKRIKTKHRRSSTLPTHRRVDEFTSLQYNLHPFDLIPIETVPTRPYVLSKSQSFQHSTRRRSLHRRAASTRTTNYPHSDIGTISKEWECGVLDFALAFESSDEKVNSGHYLSSGALNANDSLDSNDDGYESDPEIFCRNDSAPLSNSDVLKPMHSQPSHTLQEFLNERNTFIWHTTSSKSIAVYVWIELGQQLYDSLVLPKLCWKPILSNTNSPTKSKRTNMVGGTFSSMELLSICRIRQVDNTDREQYPFAQTQRLFSIQATVDEYDNRSSIGNESTPKQRLHTIILEARSIADRIRYTNLLKLTVSNLAAKFITNDPNALRVFFHSQTISDYTMV